MEEQLKTIDDMKKQLNALQVQLNKLQNTNKLSI